MPLTFLGIGETGRITGLTGRLKVRQNLTELGFVLGQKIKVIQHTFGDNIIVALESGRMALDRKMAHQINISLERKET